MTTWNIDSSHSGVHFAVRHMVVAKVRGAFTRYQGTIDFDEKKPEASKVSVRIEAASIDTREPQRDGHLRSPDFFDVATYPRITFKSTKVEPEGDHEYRVAGDLTIRNVTRQVTFDAEYSGQLKDLYGMQRAGLSAKATINRKDWGLNYNQALESGGVLVGDKVSIEIDLAAVQAPVAQPASAQSA